MIIHFNTFGHEVPQTPEFGPRTPILETAVMIRKHFVVDLSLVFLKLSHKVFKQFLKSW